MANVTLLTEKEAVNRLQTQVETLESQVAKTRAELEALQSSSETASKEAAAAAAVEHEALVKAKADLDSIRTETENLKAAHAKTLEEVSSKVGVLENRIFDLATVEAELASSKREREENANRISELEIEVLEAKESVERAEDEQTRATARTKSLEGELAKSTTASELVLKAKEDEHASQVEVIRKQHSEELTGLKTEQESLSSQLVKLEGALADAQVSLEQARAEHLANSEEHTAAIQLLEQSNQAKLAELDAELQRVSKELEVCSLNLNIGSDINIIPGSRKDL
jgi:predicted  nucleic acid-binding Zn-ribbon protein